MSNTATVKVKVDDKELQKLNETLKKTAGEGFDRIARSAQDTAKVIRRGFDIAIGAAAFFGDATKSEFEELANKSIILANTYGHKHQYKHIIQHNGTERNPKHQQKYCSNG